MTNNKLTDEKIKRRINAIEDRRSASRDFWDGDYEYPECIELLALRDLQERRKADSSEPVLYAMRGPDSEQVHSQQIRQKRDDLSSALPCWEKLAR
ncbi:hypothetical protein [Escherichia coli]|jgi:hypothetical protein|uniref:hypothetical protein n=1 Tax=Escherichia coli TaxID=562 RepID=UPI0004D38F89|nr:hypothetical protein AB85_1420 [Escherichia coli 2-156-04_S3_C1]